MKGFIGLFLVATCISAVVSQLPPRPLSIPGAIPLGGPERVQQYRNDRIVPSPNVVRIRRPLVRPQSLNSLPIQQTRTIPILEDAKPVTEENEDLPEPFVPQIISSPPSQPSPPQSLFTNEPSNYESDEALHQQNQPQQQQQQQQAPPRFQPQERPAPQRVQQDRFVPIEIPSSGAQRFNTNSQPKPAPRPRPVYRDPPQQQIRQQQPQQYQEEQQIRQAPRPIQSRPTQLHSHDESQRERKPVAQILRKYRDENEDGTITWGFENDDGSFKEEIIGIDCVTRGRYGYVDPDGLKREYNYETGILCDPNKRGQEEDDEETKGYIDYQENKAVLPNGVRIDLTQMGKNKSKRPSSQGQQQQQQFYRN